MARMTCKLPPATAWRFDYSVAQVLPHNGDQRRTWIYRLANADNDTLYVGITEKHVVQRLAQHRRYQPWWNDVTGARAMQVCCREYAACLEAYLIRSLHARWNKERPTPGGYRTRGLNHGEISSTTAEVIDGLWVCT